MINLCLFTGAALYKTTCCEQYACTRCILEYLHSQSVAIEAGDEGIDSVVEKLPNVKCPYCAMPVQFQKVRPAPRDSRNTSVNACVSGKALYGPCSSSSSPYTKILPLASPPPTLNQ